MYCPKCGATVNENSTSCGNCQLQLSKGTPFAPYNPMTDNHFFGAISLLTLFPLLGFLLPIAVDSGLVRMLGLAIGMLLHISTTIIFESAPEHRFNAARFVAVIIGALLAALSIH